MQGCQEQAVRRREFAEMHAKLDRLDEAIRGNGKPGIQIRLDRLEQRERARGRLVWLVIGSIVTLGVAVLWKHLIG